MPMLPARIIYPSSALTASRHGKKNSAHIFLKKKTGHVTKNSGVSKFFWGTQKIFGDQQYVFGADLRKNGEPKVNLGSGENIFGHLIFLWGLKKIFSGVENVSTHIINISAHKINVSAQIIFPQTLFIISEYFPTWPSIGQSGFVQFSTYICYHTSRY